MAFSSITSSSSDVYGCPLTALSSLVDAKCLHLATLLPEFVTDKAGCTSAYVFESAEAKCASSYAGPCLNYNAWSSDIAVGLAACASTTDLPTGTGGTAVQTTAAETGPSAGITGTASVTVKPTSGATSTSTDRAVATIKSSGANTGGMKGLAVVGLVGSLALMVLQVGF